MTDNFQEIDGIGPSREKGLKEANYNSYAELAEADPEKLEQQISRLSEDKALEIIVQAQNLSNSEQKEHTQNSDTDGSTDEESVVGSETGDVRDSVSSQVSSDSTEKKSDSGSSESPETYPVEIVITGGAEYDALYDALLQHRQKLIGTNRKGIDRTSEYIDALRDIRPAGTLEIELTASELNNFQNAILQQRLDYQGRNLSEKMEALRRIENRVNELREEYLF